MFDIICYERLLSLSLLKLQYLTGWFFNMITSSSFVKVFKSLINDRVSKHICQRMLAALNLFLIESQHNFPQGREIVACDGERMLWTTPYGPYGAEKCVQSRRLIAYFLKVQSNTSLRENSCEKITFGNFEKSQGKTCNTPKSR